MPKPEPKLMVNVKRTTRRLRLRLRRTPMKVKRRRMPRLTGNPNSLTLQQTKKLGANQKRTKIKLKNANPKLRISLLKVLKRKCGSPRTSANPPSQPEKNDDY